MEGSATCAALPLGGLYFGPDKRSFMFLLLAIKEGQGGCFQKTFMTSLRC